MAESDSRPYKCSTKPNNDVIPRHCLISALRYNTATLIQFKAKPRQFRRKYA